MKLVITLSPHLQSFVLLQFKGEFEVNDDMACKQHMLLGDIEKMEDGKYKLQIGLMDVIGVTQELKERVAIVQTVKAGSNDRELLIRGFADMKLIFDKRPVPIMERHHMRTTEVMHSFAPKH